MVMEECNKSSLNLIPQGFYRGACHRLEPYNWRLFIASPSGVLKSIDDFMIKNVKQIFMMTIL